MTIEKKIKFKEKTSNFNFEFPRFYVEYYSKTKRSIIMDLFDKLDIENNVLKLNENIEKSKWSITKKFYKLDSESRFYNVLRNNGKSIIQIFFKEKLSLNEFNKLKRILDEDIKFYEQIIESEDYSVTLKPVRINFKKRIKKSQIGVKRGGVNYKFRKLPKTNRI